MAYEGISTDWTFAANADLSTKQYRIVKLHTDGTIVVSSQGTNALDQLGILQDKPAAAGRACQVRLQGISKAVAGAAINPGASVMSDGNGAVIAATNGKMAIGIHIGTSAAAASDIVPILLTGIFGAVV